MKDQGAQLEHDILSFVKLDKPFSTSESYYCFQQLIGRALIELGPKMETIHKCEIFVHLPNRMQPKNRKNVDFDFTRVFQVYFITLFKESSGHTVWKNEKITATQIHFSLNHFRVKVFNIKS